MKSSTIMINLSSLLYFFILLMFLLALPLINNSKVLFSTAFILPTFQNVSTLVQEDSGKNQSTLPFSELYPNLASLKELLTSSFSSTGSVSLSVVSSNSKQSDLIDQNQDKDWISEDLLPKDKTLIHVKLIKKVAKKIDINNKRRKFQYLKDKILKFDAPFKILKHNFCEIAFNSMLSPNEEGEVHVQNNYELQKFAKKIQVQISGINCCDLHTHLLIPFHNNITHLVVRNTCISSLTKFFFGKAKLMKLIRLDIIDNPNLQSIQTRAFDGLSYLSYLSIINNPMLNHLDFDVFAGIKNLEELIYIGNGEKWTHSYLNKLFKSMSTQILPNLIHIHLSQAKINAESIDQDEEEYESNLMLDMFNRLNRTSSILNRNTQNCKPDFFYTNENSDNFNLKKSVENDKFQNLSNFVNIKPTDLKMTNKVQFNEANIPGIKLNKDDLMYISQVKYLQLDECNLVYIHPLAFQPLLSNLTSLSLAYNSKLSVDNLKQILYQFSSTNIAFKKIRKSFEQHNNQTNSMSVTIGLNSLDLSGSINTLTVPKDLFTVISKTTIKSLFIRNTVWNKLKMGDLPPMPQLRQLNIEYSLITEIEEDVFNGLENLLSLSFRGNLLFTMPLNMLKPMPNLQKLDLSGFKSSEKKNSIFFVPFELCKKTFVFGTNLKFLSFDYKKIVNIQRKNLIGLFKLERLFLKGTGLQMIEYLSFFSLKSIIKVDLSYNSELIKNIKEAEEDTFVGLEAIEEVNLSYCNLTSEDMDNVHLFMRMHEHVKILNLSNNRLTSLKSSTFADFLELRELNLAGNMIKSWHNFTIFAKNQFITTLDISFNTLTDITPEMLADFKRLKKLSFANNPLNCDCKWQGPLLLLNNDKDPKDLNKIQNKQVQEHIENLVNRQQQIVTTVYSSSSETPPKSILDWMQVTNIQFLRNQHPLRSSAYYCVNRKVMFNVLEINSTLVNSLRIHNQAFEEFLSLNSFFNQSCQINFRNSNHISFTLLVAVAAGIMLLTMFCLMVAFVYHSTLRNLITMMDEDFLHKYEYDAFVSYNVNDSDWVFNKLVPNLENVPNCYTSLNFKNKENIENHIIDDQKLKDKNNHPFKLKQKALSENFEYNVIRSNLSNKKQENKSLNDSSTKQSNKKNDFFSKISSLFILRKKSESRKKMDQANIFKENNRVNSNQIKLCVYDRDFVAGRPISECISESIRNSRKVILVISKNFAQSPWCRFETDMAHHTLVDQNRDGLILIKLEENICSEMLEKIAPQLHFLLKTRIYLQWSEDEKEQQMFWRKLHHALGFTKNSQGTYGKVRQYYQNYRSNAKSVLKRRHSVMLIPNKNCFQKIDAISYSEEGTILKVNDKLSLNSLQLVQQNSSFELQKNKLDNSNQILNGTLEEKQNQLEVSSVDFKGTINPSVELKKNPELEIIQQTESKTRNALVCASTISNVFASTSNLFPQLYDKLLMLKSFIVNLVLGLSIRN